MYKAVELKALNYKPKINDISLKVLSEYYEMYLYPFIFHYSLTTQNKVRNIELRFEYENFCHLLGIEKVAKNFISKNDLYKYRGVEGWKNISKGIIDIKHLKQNNKKTFNDIKGKLVYFYLLPQLVDEPLGVNYDIQKVVPKTNIDCEILFYSMVKGDKAIIHLGIQKHKKGYYFPKTFFVEKVSDKKTIHILIIKKT